MRAMVLDAPRRAPARGGAAATRSPARARCCSRSRPAASAAPTCTSSTASCPTRSCRSCPATRSSASPSDGRRLGRALARLDCGECRYCRERPREPLRPRALHRLPPRRRLRRAGRRGRALLLPDPRRLPRRRGRPAPLRRPDRLPLAAPRRRRRAASASTASAPRRTSSRRSRATRDGASSPSRARATPTAQAFARELGAEWAGGSDERPPEELDAAIVFAPVGELVPAALAAVAKGGAVVCAGIHMSDIPSLPVRAALGRARRPLGREPDARGRRGVPRARAARAGAHRGRDVPAGRGERRARASPVRPSARLDRAGYLVRIADAERLDWIGASRNGAGVQQPEGVTNDKDARRNSASGRRDR